MIGDDEDCLQAARRADPHVVIAEAGTPQGEGLSAISAVRDALPETCVIALADSGTQESVQRTIRAALVARKNGAADPVVPARRAPAGERRLPAFVYRPNWDVKRKLISTYFCVPELLMQLPPANGTGGLPLTSAQAVALANLDILTLRKVMSDLETQRQAGRRVLLGCTVHFSTLKDADLRSRYLSVCRTIDANCRSDLIIEVILTADDTGQFRAVDTACALETYCRAKLVRLPRHQTSFVALRRQRIRALGLEPASLSPGRGARS